MSPYCPVAIIILGKIQLYVLIRFLFEVRKPRRTREEPSKCLFSVYQGFLTCLRTALGNPWQFLFQLMINILVKIVGSNKTFLFFVKHATLIHLIQTEIVGDILVIQKSSHTDRTNDFGFLSFSWGYLRFERL